MIPVSKQIERRRISAINLDKCNTIILICHGRCSMARDPKIGYRIKGLVIGVKGKCSFGHREGEEFEISCYDSGGLCGFFYHDIFPVLATLQFGGSMPWWDKDAVEVSCPDRENEVKLRLERVK
ncbi:MAG: TIGR04076 family protein [Candidatus Bathyarchaeia archaeon]